MGESVFGYGSLASPSEAHAIASDEPQTIELEDFARSWTVAMLNSAPENDEKHYVDGHTGERPDIYVAFLNLEPRRGAACNGVAIPVDPETLQEFDAREVSYERIDVSRGATPRQARRVWSYTGTSDGVERYHTGLAEGRVFFPHGYAEYCRAAFASLGTEALRRYDETTEPPGCPGRDLVLRRAP